MFSLMLLAVINSDNTYAKERRIESEQERADASIPVEFKCFDGSQCSCSCSSWPGGNDFTLSNKNTKISCNLHDQYSSEKVNKDPEPSTR